jgi:DnaJ-class molecular chaperone
MTKHKSMIGCQMPVSSHQAPQKPKQKCYACNGSGYYDSNGSPPCGACDGTGLEHPYDFRVDNNFGDH